jgi:hypothetical protein
LFNAIQKTALTRSKTAPVFLQICLTIMPRPAWARRHRYRSAPTFRRSRRQKQKKNSSDTKDGHYAGDKIAENDILSK